MNRHYPPDNWQPTSLERRVADIWWVPFAAGVGISIGGISLTNSPIFPKMLSLFGGLFALFVGGMFALYPIKVRIWINNIEAESYKEPKEG